MTRLIRFPGTMNVPSTWPKFTLPNVADDFNRADGPMGTTSVGAKSWSAPSAVISGNMMSAGAPGGYVPNYINVGQANYDVEVTIGAIGASASTRAGGLLVRWQDANNYWYLSTRLTSSADGLTFYSTINGATGIASGSTNAAVAPVAGQKLKVTATAGLLIGYLDGVEVARCSTGTLFDTTGFGVGMLAHPAGTALKFDNLAVTFK